MISPVRACNVTMGRNEISFGYCPYHFHMNVRKSATKCAKEGQKTVRSHNWRAVGTKAMSKSILGVKPSDRFFFALIPQLLKPSTHHRIWCKGHEIPFHDQDIPHDMPKSSRAV